MQTTIFHSDDYGMSVASSRYILNCCDHGVLNSVAIMPNSPAFADCCQMLAPYVADGRIQISVHLNLVEGKALSHPEEIPTLVDEQGYFYHSFEQLFLLSLSPKRGKLKKEIKQELLLQIQKIQDAFPGVPLALDSHQHFHMIPLIFEVVLEIIRESSLSVRYVRMSREPLLPFLRTPSLYAQIIPINIIKNILLNIFSWWDFPRLKHLGIPTNLFWGLMFSGHMNFTVVSKLLPQFEQIALRKGMPLEILSHPCPITDVEECLDKRKKDFVAFYFSNGRYEEADMLKSIL